jgi:hypothetical protein
MKPTFLLNCTDFQAKKSCVINVIPRIKLFKVYNPIPPGLWQFIGLFVGSLFERFVHLKGIASAQPLLLNVWLEKTVS